MAKITQKSIVRRDAAEAYKQRRYHYIWPDGDLNGRCDNPDCKRGHFGVVLLNEDSRDLTP